MDSSLYALYLGTFVTLTRALRGCNRLRVQQIVTDALVRTGPERLASVLAVTDASWGRRRSPEDLEAAFLEAGHRDEWQVAERTGTRLRWDA